ELFDLLAVAVGGPQRAVADADLPVVAFGHVRDEIAHPAVGLAAIDVAAGALAFDILTAGRTRDQRKTERDDPHGSVIALGHGDAQLLLPGARRTDDAS